MHQRSGFDPLKLSLKFTVSFVSEILCICTVLWSLSKDLFLVQQRSPQNVKVIDLFNYTEVNGLRFSEIYLGFLKMF